MYYNVRLPKRAWWLATNQTEKLAHDSQIESNDLTLKHISGAFYALGISLALCVVVFALEFLFYHKEKVLKRRRL